MFRVELNEINTKENLEKQLGLIIEGQKQASIKAYNKDIISNMSIDDLKETDLLEFCIKAKEICETNQIIYALDE